MEKAWLIDLARSFSREQAAKISQFGLAPLHLLKAPAQLLEALQLSGVWSTRNMSRIAAAISSGNKFNVLVGFRPNADFHLGHLTLMRELSLLIALGGRPFFIVAAFEDGTKRADASKASVERFLAYYKSYTGQSVPSDAPVICDVEDVQFRQLADAIAGSLPLDKVMRIFGYNATSVTVGQLLVPAMMAAAYLYPEQVNHLPTLVLTDINQAPYGEVSKLSARSLHLPEPALSYRLLLPSLTGPSERMSIKQPRSVVFLSESRESARSKLQAAFTGGRPSKAEQQLLGGTPERCSLYRAFDLLADAELSADTYRKCVSGRLFCSDCKKERIPQMLSALDRLSPSA